jgi:hypothetical protein
VTVTRLVGGLTPGDGSDPRTFPAIWNATADVIDAVEADSLPTSIGTAVAGQLLRYDGTNWVNVGVNTALGSGKILQVVSAIKTDTFSTASTTPQNITGLSASITPSSSSNKILILGTIYVSSENAGGSYALIGLSGGNAASYVNAGGLSFGGFGSGAQNGSWGTDPALRMQVIQANYLDSPNTTSSITYQFTMRVGFSGTSYVNRYANNTADQRQVSTITLMEVAG